MNSESASFDWKEGRTLKLAILNADAQTFAKSSVDMDTLFLSYFERVAKEYFPNWRVEVRNFRVCPISEFPRPHEVDTFDGFVVTGSRLNIGEGHTWIDPLMNFIRAHYRRHRFLGVCFGHQIIQAALGGKVEARDAELGRFPVQLDDVGRKILNTRREELSVYLAHKYHVVESSPLLANFGATTLCKSQFSAIPNHILTTQFHPEVDSKLMLETLTDYWPPADDVREATMANFWDENNVPQPVDDIWIGAKLLSFLVAGRCISDQELEVLPRQADIAITETEPTTAPGLSALLSKFHKLSSKFSTWMRSSRLQRQVTNASTLSSTVSAI